MKPEEIIRNWSITQPTGATLPCPRCGMWKMREAICSNALSRRANIYICPECGTDEALEDYPKAGRSKRKLSEWAICRAFGEHEADCTETEDGWLLKIPVALSVTTEEVDDIMCAALEGGITYWCREAEVVGECLGEFGHEQIAQGGELLLHDTEANEVYSLNLRKLMSGISLAVIKGYAHDWFHGNKIDTGMVDAPAADIIIQFALFGEIVYG